MRAIIDTRKSAHAARYVFTFANYRQLFAYVITIDLVVTVND